MPKNVDLSGKRFGRLTVIGRDTARDGYYWICQCNCGSEPKSINGSSLKRGLTTSCGCYSREKAESKAINLVGQKFGRLTVISKADKKGSGVYWVCDCDCGKKSIIASSYDMRNGKKTSCGCEREEQYDLTGQRFGLLTVIGKSSKKNSSGDTLWICDCDCGTKRKLISRSNLLAKGKYKTISCGCYTKAGKHLINKDSDREHHIKVFLYGKLKARNRKIGFDNKLLISFDEYVKIVNMPCFYCGLENSNTTYDTECYEYRYKEKEVFEKTRTSDTVLYHNGVDRIDSSKGYEFGNVVPCCKYCNMAKMDHTLKEFLEWGERAYQHFAAKGKED